MPVTSVFAERAWLGGDTVARRVLVEIDGDRFGPVVADVGTPPPDALVLPGIVLPGLANAHSHAFHRALRGRTHSGAGDFWSWRDRMYAVAGRLDPDSYHALARATYAEMALAGITTVGEFHYLHHPAAGGRYADPNAVGHALVAAAEEAGVRLTLLDTCYLQADVRGAPLAGPQLRFTDGDAQAWAERAAAQVGVDAAVRIGAAVHSVRAVPPAAMRVVADWAAQRQAPLHLHLSEQRRENEECMAATGRTPTELAADTGVLGGRATAVHATHLTDADIALLGDSATNVCMCPTTERDLADGIGPAGRLAAAGSPLSLGSDSHAVIDLLEEARAVELDERLATQRRGRHRPADLLRAATVGGAGSLGWPEAGTIGPGQLADLAAVRLDSPRLAGAPETDADLLAAVVFAATAADVTDVLVAGRQVVRDGRHLLVEDVPAALDAAIRAVLTD